MSFDRREAAELKLEIRPYDMAEADRSDPHQTLASFLAVVRSEAFSHIGHEDAKCAEYLNAIREYRGLYTAEFVELCIRAVNHPEWHEGVQLLAPKVVGLPDDRDGHALEGFDQFYSVLIVHYVRYELPAKLPRN